MNLGSYLKLLDDHPELIGNENALLKLVRDGLVITSWQEKYQEELAQKNLPPEWGEIGVVFEDPYKMIIRDLVQFPEGELRGYGRLIASPNLKGGMGVAILPEFQGKILLLHQYRHPTRLWHYEIPRGHGEANTPAPLNARKEIEEETGGEVNELMSLGEIHHNTGFDNESVVLFYAKLDSIGTPEINEGIGSFVWLTVKALEEWIADEKITDGFTIAAYTKAKLKGLI